MLPAPHRQQEFSKRRPDVLVVVHDQYEWAIRFDVGL
jgi:hypothetical protein